MSLPIAPELFDVLTEYANNIAQGKVKATPSLGATSPALTFCENFYSQFFQNRLRKPIEHINLAAKQSAVRLRLELKETKAPLAVIQLITWFEKLCEIYPNVLALSYGVASKFAFFDFHENYLLTLLERTAAWARVEKHAGLEEKASASLVQLKEALHSIPR